ncbi:BET5 Trafficking protein particle complex subunit BET5 [Candida maltosa Xu316]
MTIHSFFIFDRHCNCIYNREYGHTPSSSDTIPGQINKNNDSNSSKLLFGILYSLKTISNKLVDESSINQLKSFNLGQFKIHFYESLSNFKFILITNVEVEELSSVLFQLYSEYFIKYVVENGLSPVEFSETGEYSKINNGRFIEETDKYLQSLSIF